MQLNVQLARFDTWTNSLLLPAAAICIKCNERPAVNADHCETCAESLYSPDAGA
jgi:hypothetical protein